MRSVVHTLRYSGSTMLGAENKLSNNMLIETMSVQSHVFCVK